MYACHLLVRRTWDDGLSVPMPVLRRYALSSNWVQCAGAFFPGQQPCRPVPRHPRATAHPVNAAGRAYHAQPAAMPRYRSSTAAALHLPSLLVLLVVLGAPFARNTDGALTPLSDPRLSVHWKKDIPMQAGSERRWAGTLSMTGGIAREVPVNLTVALSSPTDGIATATWTYDKDSAGKQCVAHTEAALRWTKGVGDMVSAVAVSPPDFYSLTGRVQANGATNSTHFAGNITAPNGHIKGTFNMTLDAPAVSFITSRTTTVRTRPAVSRKPGQRMADAAVYGTRGTKRVVDRSQPVHFCRRPGISLQGAEQRLCSFPRHLLSTSRYIPPGKCRQQQHPNPANYRHGTQPSGTSASPRNRRIVQPHANDRCGWIYCSGYGLRGLSCT